MNTPHDSLLSKIDHAFTSTPNAFPRAGALKYPDIIRGWIANLDANLLPYVTAGAIAKDGGHLTLHDKEHIDRVKHLTNDLVNGLSSELHPYELVLILCSVYMHDIGNILGRAGHEGRIAEVLRAVGAPAGFDAVETRTAKTIAGVHGGKVSGSKDTIGTLPEEAIVHGKKVRPRLLAALVRLADELADDPARANRVQLATGTIPKQAEIYHHYAANLHSQLPDAPARTIYIQMEFSDASIFERKLGKGLGEADMLDEIFERSLKTYHEAKYCSRFLRPLLDFERVNVDVAIYHGDGPLLENIKFSLVETGYGDAAASVYALAPELEKFAGNGRLTPEVLRRRIEAARTPDTTDGTA